MTKSTFLMSILILGGMTSIGTDVLAQERGPSFSTPGKMESIDNAPLINQESPETSTGTVTGEMKSEGFTFNNDLINNIKEQCNRRDPKIANPTLNKACVAVGCPFTVDLRNPCK